jgi:hypothetical protein
MVRFLFALEIWLHEALWRATQEYEIEYAYLFDFRAYSHLGWGFDSRFSIPSRVLADSLARASMEAYWIIVIRMYYTITSSKDALQRAKKLKSHWSNELELELRTVIYMTSVLEEIAQNARRRKGGKRKKSAWNMFLSEQMKQGYTMKMAAAMYAEHKTKK